MKQIELTKSEACEFMVRAQLLCGPKLKKGQKSILKVLDRLRAIQVDPIDVCGANHEIALNSRIDGFTPPQLEKVLYEKRAAFEGWSKALCILPAESKPYYEPVIRKIQDSNADFLREHKDTIDRMLNEIRAKGPMCSSDFEDDRRYKTGWGFEQRLVRGILDILWASGIIMIHHRKGRVKYYDLTERCIPWSEDEKSYEEYKQEMIMNHLRAMRLFRPKGPAGEPWYKIKDIRDEIVDRQTEAGEIIPVDIEGCKGPYSLLKEDLVLLKKTSEPEKIVRLIAPLDSMLWDRTLVREVFDFNYVWEVYMPPKKRKWGYYCLPILWGTEFVGRTDLARDRSKNALEVKAVHWESGFKPGDDFLGKFAAALKDHSRFAGCDKVLLTASGLKGKGKLAHITGK